MEEVVVVSSVFVQCPSLGSYGEWPMHRLCTEGKGGGGTVQEHTFHGGPQRQGDPFHHSHLQVPPPHMLKHL